MMRFSDWLAQRESTARTRAIGAFTNGTGVYPGGNVNSHDTASPSTVAKFNSKFGKHKKKRKFGATKNRKKVSNLNHNKGVDKWIKESDKLKDALLTLKSIFDKKKELAKDEPKVKPEEEKDKKNKGPDADEKGKDQDQDKDSDLDSEDEKDAKEDGDKADKKNKPAPKVPAKPVADKPSLKKVPNLKNKRI